MMSPMQKTGSGPLAGIKVVEMAGIGPGPFGTMLLGDLGARIIRVERKGAGGTGPASDRNRVAIGVDLKSEPVGTRCSTSSPPPTSWSKASGPV